MPDFNKLLGELDLPDAGGGHSISGDSPSYADSSSPVGMVDVVDVGGGGGSMAELNLDDILNSAAGDSLKLLDFPMVDEDEVTAEEARRLERELSQGRSLTVRKRLHVDIPTFFLTLIADAY